MSKKFPGEVCVDTKPMGVEEVIRKRVYYSPELRCHGDVRDITLGGSPLPPVAFESDVGMQSSTMDK